MLAPDGVLAFSTGDVGHFWSRLQGRQHRIYNPPQHLFYFSRTSMTRMAIASGLRVLRIEPDEKVTTLHYVLHIARNLVDIPFLAKMFEFIMRVLPDWRVRMKLIDNLVVYCTPEPVGSAASSPQPDVATSYPR